VSISIIRIKFLKLTEDYTWENVEAAGWSIGELCCGLTCSCLLTFRPLVAHWCPGLSALLTRSSNKYARPDYSNESGGIQPSRPESHRPRRKVPTSESKDDLYAEAHFELSQHSYRMSQGQGSYGGGADSGDAGCELGELEGSPRSGRTLSHTQTGSEGTIEGLRSDQRAEVTTHIAAGHMTEKKPRSQSRRSSPIQIRCDIVQEVAPAWHGAEDGRFRLP
jgi:rhodopsin domain-containing protein